MGCGSSTDGRSPGRGGNYHANHPGLKPPGYGFKLDSTEGTDIRDPDPNDNTSLQIEKADLLIKENTIGHRTNEYDITTGQNPKLVIRRGQCFDICLTTNRPYDKSDDLKLVFRFGKKPSPNKATHVELDVSDKDEPLAWGAKVIIAEDKSVTLRLITPPQLYVGKWNFNVDVIKKEDDKNVVYRYKHQDPIYILFNPWCKDDQVYHNDNELLEEYVLTETGKIYTGGSERINPKSWNFGQFEDVMLDCALYLLDSLSNIPATSRGDPIKITRSLTSAANSPNNDGVLMGNWSGRYGDGISPMKWSGSVAILKKFYETKTPVKYGQCWVFSGVLTTLCRTIGIPARSVTNFSSAHDCEGSITIDKHFDEEGDEIDWRNDDSIWNFHVWNDAWMARPDLPEGYGGWQAIDATPQETSDGVFCCGPFPVLAIKRGMVNLPYDGCFIYAEVNADQIYWQVDKYGVRKKTRTVKDKVGKFISTKAPDCKGMQSPSWNCWDWEREDVTDEYKFKEGTQAERASVITANQKGTNTAKDLYSSTENEDVKFELIRAKDIKYGENFELALKATNESKSNRTIGGSLSTYTIYYTGIKFKDIKKDRFSNQVLAPGESTELKLSVTFNEYFDHLTDDCHLHASCMAQVKETKQVFAEQENFQLLKPVPEIKVCSIHFIEGRPTTMHPDPQLALGYDNVGPEEVKIGETFTVTISFKNQLPIALTNCELVVEGPGLQQAKTIQQNNVPKDEEFRTSFDLTPAKKGKKEVIATFHSTQMEQVGGSYKVNVVEA